MKLNSFFQALAVAMTASVAVLSPDTATANSFADQIESQLVQASIAAQAGGQRLTHDPYLNTLSDNRSNFVTINLRAGRSYNIVGVCDEDCHDIDLHLYDENGGLIDSDTSTDDIPVVSVTPRWSGPFRIKVGMPGCAARYCYYGVGVFGK